MIRHRKLNTECLVTSAARVYRKQKQIVVPFIWGILVGITITAVLFQQHILFSGEIHWPVEGGRLLDIDDKIRNSVYLNNSLSHEQNRTTVSSRFIHHHLEHNLQSPDAPALSQAEETFRTKTRIFVGVISAEKFLNSRAVAVNNTWGNQVDKLEFFAEHGTPEQFGVPVVNLDG
uniref:Hexosyltransferase n=1 Tax=Ciona savignyi TaxID=51511 RepID=H2Y7S1_CIOSA